MTYVIAKPLQSGGFAFIRSLSRNGDIKDNELAPLDHAPVFVRHYATESAAMRSLDAMQSRGHDDYCIYDWQSFRFLYTARGARISE